MRKCPACTNRNVPEKIIHWVIYCISKIENFIPEHYIQNGPDDRRGRDLGITFQKETHYIQVKGFREIRRTDIERRVAILEGRFKDFKRDPKKFKRYVYTIVNRYKRLRLLKNDGEIRERFKKFVQTTSFFKKFNEENDFGKILELFIGIEHFINIFESAIIHFKRYPSVKLFFIVDMTKGIDRQKRTAILIEECHKLIRQALKLGA